jgi:hypothetical protein
MPGRRARGSQVQAITSAPRALAEDVHDRTVRYLISMGIRTACFLLLLVVPGPWKWVCVVGAVVLPLVAVLVANAGRERSEAPPTLLGPPDEPAPRQLPYDPTTEYLR